LAATNLQPFKGVHIAALTCICVCIFTDN